MSRSSRHGGRAAESQPADKKLVLLCQHFYPEMISTGMQPMHRLAAMLSAADLSVVCLERGHTGISVPSKAYGVHASGTRSWASSTPTEKSGR